MEKPNERKPTLTSVILPACIEPGLSCYFYEFYKHDFYALGSGASIPSIGAAAAEAEFVIRKHCASLESRNLNKNCQWCVR